MSVAADVSLECLEKRYQPVLPLLLPQQHKYHHRHCHQLSQREGQGILP